MNGRRKPGRFDYGAPQPQPRRYLVYPLDGSGPRRILRPSMHELPLWDRLEEACPDLTAGFAPDLDHVDLSITHTDSAGSFTLIQTKTRTGAYDVYAALIKPAYPIAERERFVVLGVEAIASAPPQRAHQVLCLIYSPERLEEVAGDLEEMFHKVVDRHGSGFAKLWYCLQVGGCVLGRARAFVESLTTLVGLKRT